MRPMKLRFTIRDLFWLVLVAALAVGWWLDHIPHSVLAKNFYPDHVKLQEIYDSQGHSESLIEYYEREIAELKQSSTSK
jgi:hypothetical protein